AAALPVLDLLARREDDAAERAAHALAEAAADAQPAKETSGWWPARHLAAATLEFVGMVRTRETPSETEEIDEFEPAVSLAMGNLPGSPAVARDVTARGSRWNPLVKRAMTTRQAVQVAVAGALAIMVGRELSATRYYWAVIAAFIMFTGTGSRSETFVKGFNRVLGTLAGLFVSIWAAQLTVGHTWLVLAVVIGSVFCGFYLIRLSYAYMIFFITIMVGQLYTVLHRFSDGIMVLRLEETVIGAVIGFAVAMVVVPVSTRDTVRTARDNLLNSLSELLRSVADRLEGVTPERNEDDELPPPLDQLARAVDDRVRQLALVAKPLLRPLVWGNSPPRTRHRVALYGATATHARGLTVALRRHTGSVEAPAAACRALADAADVLVEAPPGRHEPTAQEPLGEADAALYADPCDTGTRTAAGTDPVLRHLMHLHQLLHEIATPGSPTPSSARKPAAGPVPVSEPERTRP
ncbi:MAG TPA: FUSC family protein, partial [Streptomyces sp.]|nr:FUSC family protein [Streptomyces sp.]